MTFRRIALAASILSATPALAQSAEVDRWKAQAARITITRDDWGIAHVRGVSDADAVFGAIYAQAEDDFNRIETNYLANLGRLAEAEGESALWQDLRARLFTDPDQLKAAYADAPAWLKALMVAWADGLNFYLATHPDRHPRVLARFEPWMALSFTEGSIGGDVEKVNVKALEALYGMGREAKLAADLRYREPQGSNGFAIAPKNTAAGHALLLINPHTSFFFRSELQMQSDAGLNAYGASTWGQFFIYQGFNDKAGWMHTTSGVDSVDEFAESITLRDGRPFYRVGSGERPMVQRPITLAYRTANGGRASRTITTFASRHGPITRVEDGKWIATAMMVKPIAALEQSFLRTKAVDYASFVKVAGLQANSSNNTLFADAKGEIAYLHPQFVPVRDDRFDYTRPVDGSDPAADWRGLTPLARLPQVKDPASGWIMNVNDWPWQAAGVSDSPRREDFPRYMDQVGPNARTPHALMVLEGKRDFTPERLIAAAYDPFLPAFARLLPPLFSSLGRNADKSLVDAVKLLKGWDMRWSAESTATSVAVFYGEALYTAVAPTARAQRIPVYDYMAERTSGAQRLAALRTAVDRLTRDFGSWQVPWGQINRYQRNDGAITQTFDDAKPSIPVPFTSSQWGSLASFGAKAYPGTKRYYGTSGNSFVAVVEFGPKVRAWAVTAGGESGDPTSRHFADQAQRYAAGALRPVYYYPEDLAGHIERQYRPGE